MNQLTLKAILLSLIMFATPIIAEQQRHIHVNGEHLSDELIGQLDSLVGNTVGDGYYWLNLQTGAWGYEGNDQTQGVVQAIASPKQTTEPAKQPARYRASEGVSSTGTVTSGRLNGQNCTFVSVGGTTMKSCD